MNAHDVLRTDWSEIDPRSRPRPYSDGPATIPCGLVTSTGRDCPERFFCEEGRESHLADDHHIGLKIVEAPAGTKAGAGRTPEGNAAARDDGSAVNNGVVETQPRTASPTPAASTKPRWGANPLSGRRMRAR